MTKAIPGTALAVAQSMKLPDCYSYALKYNMHPQDRTEAFHRMFDAPIKFGVDDETFSHMDDRRVAFRVAFILSEIFELCEKGLGLSIGFSASVKDGEISRGFGFSESSDNQQLTEVILGAMQAGGKRDIIEVVDALGDLNVVVNGFAVELGVDMSAVDQEVLASNFTKAGENGQTLVSDGTDGHPAGKILKGPNFVEPNIRAVLGLPAPSDAVAA